jgi:hypothetical protein
MGYQSILSVFAGLSLRNTGRRLISFFGLKDSRKNLWKGYLSCLAPEIVST